MTCKRDGVRNTRSSRRSLAYIILTICYTVTVLIFSITSWAKSNSALDALLDAEKRWNESEAGFGSDEAAQDRRAFVYGIVLRNMKRCNIQPDEINYEFAKLMRSELHKKTHLSRQINQGFSIGAGIICTEVRSEALNMGILFTAE